MAYESGVCTPWIVADDLPCMIDGVDEDIIEDSVTAAIEVLFALSGSQYPGTCDMTILPTSCGCHPFENYASDSSRWGNDYPGRWSNVTSVIPLGYNDVKSVDKVTIDGVELDPSAYRLEENYWLVRQDGGLWPCAQHRDLPLTEVGTWSVEITRGEDPPSLGIIAARELACEFFKAQVPGSDCKLPKRVQSIVRMGVSAIFVDPFQMLEKRRTGLYQTDLFLATYNPEDLTENFAIGIPTQLPTVIRTTT